MLKSNEINAKIIEENNKKFTNRTKYNDTHNKNHKSKMQILKSTDKLTPSILNKLFDIEGCEYRGNYNDLVFNKHTNMSDVSFQLSLRNRLLEQNYVKNYIERPFIYNYNNENSLNSDSDMNWTKNAMSRIMNKSDNDSYSSINKKSKKIGNIDNYVSEIKENSNLSINIPSEEVIQKAMNDSVRNINEINLHQCDKCSKANISSFSQSNTTNLNSTNVQDLFNSSIRNVSNNNNTTESTFQQINTSIKYKSKKKISLKDRFQNEIILSISNYINSLNVNVFISYIS